MSPIVDNHMLNIPLIMMWPKSLGCGSKLCVKPNSGWGAMCTLTSGGGGCSWVWVSPNSGRGETCTVTINGGGVISRK